MGIKPGPKRIAVSTGKPDRRQRDNKKTPAIRHLLNLTITKKVIKNGVHFKVNAKIILL